MQTFLPYASFQESAKVLDPKRLGNQFYREGLTLLRGKWPNHPASKMWRGFEGSLCDYLLALHDELTMRGKSYPHHVAEVVAYYERLPRNQRDTLPWWLGDKHLHQSHQSCLLFKDPEWYGQYFTDVKPTGPGDNGKWPYWWPV